MAWNTNGYVPDDFNTIIDKYYNAAVSQFGPITLERFTGSRTYEYCYSSAQVDMQYQAQFSEIFTKIAIWMQDVNFKINAPSTTAVAIQQKFLDKFGLNIGIKPMAEPDEGKLYIAIDYTPSTVVNQNIAQFLASECVAGGVVTMGDIVVPVSVGAQSFDYKWTKAVEKSVVFKVKVTVSRSAINYIESEVEIQKRFLDNFGKVQKIGGDIEPEKYYEIVRDAPYASDILTQFSIDGGSSFQTVVYESLFSDKWVATLPTANIEIVRP